MEIVCRVVQVGELRQRSFTDRQGQTQVINEREITISHGASCFIGMMVGNTATSFNAADPDWPKVACVCNFDVKTRTVNGEKGVINFTDIRVNSVNKL